MSSKTYDDSHTLISYGNFVCGKFINEKRGISFLKGYNHYKRKTPEFPVEIDNKIYTLEKIYCIVYYIFSNIFFIIYMLE